MIDTKVYNLYDLINLHGAPDALIDNHSMEYGYAVWGFDDIYSYTVTDKLNDHDPFDNLQEFFNRLDLFESDVKAVGFLSYDIKNFLYNHINFKSILNLKFPLIWFGKPKKILRYDLQSDYLKSEERFLDLYRDIKDLSVYRALIQKIKNQLEQGNTYQINLTMNKIFTSIKSPLDIYLSIRNYAKPDFGYFLNIGSKYILSFSPEEFFNTKQNQIYTYPMKGTIKRKSNNSLDMALKQKLKNSKKDKSEHVMIVDLLRNDLGKICEYGSINVTDLFNIKSYPTVHQMVSCIDGKLKSDTRYVDIFKALCPGGSITGAPKESSMRIIDRLEDYNREVYTGNIGYLDGDGNMHFNMAIRTMMIVENFIKYCVGGGIVWDSIAEDEWKEAQLKSKILDQFIRR